MERPINNRPANTKKRSVLSGLLFLVTAVLVHIILLTALGIILPLSGLTSTREPPEIQYVEVERPEVKQKEEVDEEPE